MSLEEYDCSCGSQAMTIHDTNCTLYQSAEFELGLAFWDADKHQLVYQTRSLQRTFDYEGWESVPPKAPLRPICEHYGTVVELIDGTKVMASRQHTRNEGERIPDLGVYLAEHWKPQCIAYYIHWPDFGLPSMEWDRVIELVDIARREAQRKWVEVGCLGGHGRTGTFLALMSVAGGANPQEAIKSVRERYCFKAIETKEQEWFVEWVHARINKLPVRPRPEPPPPIIYGKKQEGTPSWRKMEDLDLPPLAEPDDDEEHDGPSCVACGEPAVVVDVQYDDTYCDDCATLYDVYKYPHEAITKEDNDDDTE